ncbi:MAG: SNF2-related protein, partial [Halapricum sp.]
MAIQYQNRIPYMPLLPERSWDSIYESRPSSQGTYLIDEFYVPALTRSNRYDRVAGYFSSSALAVASRGIDALLENDGEMRLVVGTELYSTDRPVLEALTDELEESLDELDDEQLDAQLQLLARLLREGRLEIKVAVPREGSWRIFHPKLGIFHDGDDNALSFEGSVNETVGGWKNNYERFKVHRSWVDTQSDYVDADVETFEALWTNEHPFVEVYSLPEAIERKLIEWKDPGSQEKLEEAIQIARGEAPPTERDVANIIADGHLAPGGLALAEEASTITPWPHQRVVSDTLVNTYPNSFLLCDEVGLGKTIEAGLTLSRLGFTDELQTGLLLVPASLTVQWQEEMWEKFNLDTYRYERGSDYQYAFIDAFGREHSIPSVADLDLDSSQREQAWTESPHWRFLHQQQTKEETSGPTIVIMSWHTARLSDRWNQVAPKSDGTVRTREDVPASCRGRSPSGREGVWDAVIVDEAHNGRKPSSFYSMLEQLRAHTKTNYVLTATPMQLHPVVLFDLMSSSIFRESGANTTTSFSS